MSQLSATYERTQARCLLQVVCMHAARPAEVPAIERMHACRPGAHNKQMQTARASKNARSYTRMQVPARTHQYAPIVRHHMSPGASQAAAQAGTGRRDNKPALLMPIAAANMLVVPRGPFASRSAPHQPPHLPGGYDTRSQLASQTAAVPAHVVPACAFAPLGVPCEQQQQHQQPQPAAVNAPLQIQVARGDFN